MLFGLAFMMVPAAVTAHVTRHVPPEAISATLAAFTVVFAIGQSLGPWISGMLADHNGAGATLTVTALLCTLAAILVLRRSAKPAELVVTRRAPGRASPRSRGWHAAHPGSTSRPG
ncbi:MFS transporter [Micromonospora sp. NPDC049301]|uniref:MFS transporter n=1 Tax=Micromonospora sp. NPDC049301 TaxID=3155723 RepID=UPI00343C1C1F